MGVGGGEGGVAGQGRGRGGERKGVSGRTGEYMVCKFVRTADDSGIEAVSPFTQKRHWRAQREE